MGPSRQHPTSRHRERPFDRERLNRVAAGLADQFALLYEAKPVDPQVHMADNMLTFTFQGGFSTADESHLQAGHLAELRLFRERYLEVVGEDLKQVVEQMTGGKVTFFASSFDANSRTTNMLFVLDLLPDDAEEQREAILNWSEQVRRSARELRMSHLQTRETHIALREQMRAMRIERDGEDGEDGAEGAGAGSEVR